jgi:hypothetical protein
MKPQMYLPIGSRWDAALSILNARKRLGYWPNHKQPRTFNEHLLSEKISFSGDLRLARRLTDKIDAKQWLIEKGFESIVIPTLATASSADELRKTKLPRRCVVKPAHGSGSLLILNEERERHLSESELRKVRSWIKEDYYRRSREPNYKNLERRIIVEELLLDDSGRPPRDYKFMCARGEPFMIQVDIGRFENHSRQLYSPEWKLLPFCQAYPRKDTAEPRPEQLEEATRIARTLSRHFKLCRVDFYFLGRSDIRIGEITFFPGNCAEQFQPQSGDLEAGRLIDTILQADRSPTALLS